MARMENKARRTWEKLSHRDQSAVNLFEAFNYGNLVQFPFLELPREIRDRICFFLCGDNYFSSTKCWVKGSLGVKMRSEPPGHCESSIFISPASQLQQLQVSGQFYEEAAMIFYSSSLFHFSEPGSFAPFLSGLPSRRQAKVRLLDLTIGAKETELQQWRKLLKEYAVARFSNLRVIRIDVWVANEDPAARLPAVRFRSSDSLPLLKHATVVFHKICHTGKYWVEGSFVFDQQDMIFQEISTWLT